MSETTVEPVEVETTDTDVVTPDADVSLEVEKWKQLARKNEQRAKENADKAKRFDEFEEAQKSEMEKLQERLQAAESAAQAAEVARVRASVAARHGVPEALLVGADEAALEQAALQLLAFKGTVPATPTSEGQGKQGDPVTDGVKQLTPDELTRLSPDEIVRAQGEGRLNNILGIK